MQILTSPCIKFVLHYSQGNTVYCLSAALVGDSAAKRKRYMFIINELLYISKNFVLPATMKKILEIRNINFFILKINFLKPLHFCCVCYRSGYMASHKRRGGGELCMVQEKFTNNA